MSARVLNPAVLSEFCRMRSPVRSAAAAAIGALPSRPALAKVKRDLFGPVEQDEFKKFFDAEIHKQQQRASDRWGFNFARGHPLADHQQYMWERVPPTNNTIATAASSTLSGSDSPHMFALSRAAHLRHTATNSVLHTPRKRCAGGAAAAAAADASFSCYENLLLDERARRANEYVLPVSDDNDELNDSRLSGSSLDSSLNTSATTTTTTTNMTQTRLSLVITATTSTPSSSSSSSSSASSSSSTAVANGKPTLRSSTRQQRQPRITDYLKERKRLSATPKKVSPSKRTRLNSSLSRVA